MDEGIASSGILQQTFDTGLDQLLVLYQPPDVGSELDPVFIFGSIAADAAARAADGLRIVAMTSMPLRHAGVWPGQQGSGLETKVAVAVVYERVPRVPAT